LLADGFAFSPQGAEFGHVSLDGTLDALRVKSQQLDVLAFLEPGLGWLSL
jgi:hypothetical protein